MTEKHLEKTSAHQNALKEEQKFLDSAYQNLDQQIHYYEEKLSNIRRIGANGTPGARSERDSFATHYEDNLARLKQVEHRLVLGRLDFENTSEIHIGRVTLRDQTQNIILTDWRAPQCEPFYQATSAHRLNVVRRRHIQTNLRQVTNVEDELLATNEADDTTLNLTGEGALFAAMNKARDGKMGDIVATIQAEQDQIIRSSAKGVLVVQGGPGTGKTAVALHRAAYLLYTYRKQFAHSGILVIGPSKRFLQYIDQVLPSLGESDVVACTINDLFPGVTPTLEETPEVSAIKSRLSWQKIAKRAVRKILEKPLSEVKTFTISGTKIQLTPADVAEAQLRARQTGKAHNEAREKYARHLVNLLAKRLATARNVDLADDDWILHDIVTDPEIRRTINLHWLPSSPQWLLTHIFYWQEVLADIAPELTPTEQKLLWREKNSGFSSADIALLDELAENLGEFEDDTQRATRLAKEADSLKTNKYIAQTMHSLQLGNGIINSSFMQDRLNTTDSPASLAEHAISDRTWTYGHIVVDEAQELTAMQWRMIARRNPRRSMTIVGDLDQHQNGAPDNGWNTALGKLAENMCVSHLTISYRTPKSILENAAEMMRKNGVVVAPIKAVRDIENSYQESEINPQNLASTLNDLLTAQLTKLTALYGAGYGTIAIIAHETMLAEITKTLTATEIFAKSLHSEQISVLTAQDAKGLEFDAVILLDPSQIAASGSGNLYVAMTRATKEMHVINFLQARD